MKGRPLIDITGNRYGKLVVIGIVGKNENGHVLWRCECDCGNTRDIDGWYLRVGKAKCCGCSVKQEKHGLCKTRLYGIWRGMKRRCNNPKSKDYPGYGGKGVCVCKEWNDSFKAFSEWALQNGYTDELTIDRIDSTGNYEPSNCRWADIVVQNNNLSKNVYITIDGETHTMKEWSRITGVKYDTIKYRRKKGITGKELFEQG